MTITISKCSDEQAFLNSVRLNGLLKYNMEQTKGKLKTPDLEMTYVARDENDVIIGGVSGSRILQGTKYCVLFVREN